MKNILKAQTVLLLRQLIAIPGVATTIDEIYLGGKLLVSGLPVVENGTPIDTPTEVELSMDERAFVKKAFELAMSKQAIPASIYVNDLLETLEFVKKPATPENK